MIPESAKFLMAAGHRAPSPDNSQPWQFLWDGVRLSINHRVKESHTKIFGPGSHGSLLTMGAISENLAQASKAAGLNPEWKSTPNSDTCFLEARIDTSSLIAETCWQHPLFNRHTNRLPFKQAPLPPPLLKQLTDSKEDGVHLSVLEDRNQIRTVEGWVNIASQARFQTREIHEYFASTLRFDAMAVEGGDGLNVDSFGLPPGGRSLLKLINDWPRLSLLNKLGIYRLLGGLEAKGLRQGAAILAISGPIDPDSVIAAGRLMERIWILLNDEGVAVHPYYVVSDQLQRLAAGRIPTHLVSGIENLDAEIKQSLGPGTLHMLLRVGYPTKDPIKSRRLPLESVLLEKPDTQ